MSSALETPVCDFWLRRVDTDGNTKLEYGFEDRSEPTDLLLQADRVAAGSAALGAEIEDVGAISDHAAGSAECCLRIQVFPSVREAVWRDVEDPHKQRTPEWEIPVMERKPLRGSAGSGGQGLSCVQGAWRL